MEKTEIGLGAKELPGVETLTECQLRGASCVFCGAPFSPGNVWDLGARTIDAYGSRVQWFPRTHPHCADGAS